MDIREFLEQDDIRELIAEGNLNAVYRQVYA